LDKLEEKLGRFHGGRILDIATGQGSFLGFLLDTLEGYYDAVGVDISRKNIDQAAGNIKHERVSLQMMNGEHLGFADNSFDIVSIANSLHHCENVNAVLSEMKRVLKPGGLFLVYEMFHDGQNEMQLTHVYVHHWWAEIDRLFHVPHFETFTRDEIIKMMEALDLESVDYFEHSDINMDPKDKKMVDFMTKKCDEYIERIKDDPSKAGLVGKGLNLKVRLAEVGVQWATELCLLGRK